MRYAIGVAMLLAVCAAAQEKEKKGKLAGQVVNAVTKEPLRKATVTLMLLDGQAPEREKNVDAGGRFEFGDLAAGRYRLAATRTGFVDQTHRGRIANGRMGTTLTLTAGQEIKDIVIPLTPHAVILGRVVDEDGEGKAGVAVSAMQIQWQGKQRGLAPVSRATTNDLGEYRMYGVAAGSYLIQAGTQRAFRFGAVEAALPDKPEEGYVTTYYPGTVDLSSAARVVAKAGGELRGIDITMAKAKVVRVRGKVVDGETGKAVRAQVMLIPRGKGFMSWMDMRSTAVFDASGMFELKGVLPGSYTLRAESMSEISRMSAQMPLEAGEVNITNVSIVLQRGGSIAGEVRIEGQDKYDANGSQMWVALGSWDEESADSMNSGSAEVKQDGTFTISNVLAQKFSVDAAGMEGAFVKAVRWGDQDVMENGLDLTQGVSGGTLHIVLSKKAGEVAGSVRDEDGKAVTGATVALIGGKRDHARMGYLPFATTDQYGVFQLKSIRPGEYKLLAWESVEGLEFMDPEFSAPFLDKATSVKVSEGSKESVQLKVIPAGDVEKAKENRGQ